MEQKAILDGDPGTVEIVTDERGVMQLFNVGAERMPGYTAAEVMNKITPADISDPQEVIARHSDIYMLTAVNGNSGIEIARVSPPDVALEFAGQKVGQSK
jgi:hypothetical protein